MSANTGEQLTFPELPEPQPKKTAQKPVGAIKYAEKDPIAAVCVEKLPPHLDQLFDYAIPEKFDADIRPGVRVKVRFGAQVLDGFVVERKSTTTHEGKLSPIKSVVSKTELVRPHDVALYTTIADYYAGSLQDILRLAVPPRHAKTEKAFLEAHASDTCLPHESDEPDTETSDPRTDETEHIWQQYNAGIPFVQRVLAQQQPRAVWAALPGFGKLVAHSASAETPHWAQALVSLARQVAVRGKQTLIVVPTIKDVHRVRDVLLSEGVRACDCSGDKGLTFVELSHELTAAQRYMGYLQSVHGCADVVVGTRAAAFAPMPRVGLVVCWDDADSAHQELHAPYPHTREVLSLRSEFESCALLIGGFNRTVHAQSLLSTGWAQDVSGSRDVVRQAAPLVTAFDELEIQRDSGGKHGRLPSRVWQAIRDGLNRGPVLIQVPRSGYVPAVACVQCREAARCGQCHGPLGLASGGGVPQCTWCGALAGDWACGSCGAHRVRAIRIGSDRTAEELGRAFPGVTIKVSGAQSKGGVIEEVPARSALVIATPGAEPFVASGYVLAVLLDAQLSLSGNGLYRDQETLSRWLRACALVQSRHHGGKAFLVGQGAAVPTAGLVRWDPVGVAQRELDERRELRMPPLWRVAAVSGERLAVEAFLREVQLPSSAEVLGPVDVAEESGAFSEPGVFGGVVRAIVRVELRQGRELARALKTMNRISSAKRSLGLVSVILDPKELL
ncbi:primosomal protein N' [Timonella sp. A28]|uniref:primosomal protein N' n=1 Tax=Timonella sp. A28 TaxID=3442640 RepID=UPI003EBFC315